MNMHCSTPETICLKCGDKGFTNAFVYCVKCLEFAVHRYCLDVIPKSFDAFVQWACDDCEVKILDQPAVWEDGAIQCRTSDCTASKHILDCSGVGTKKNDIVALKTEEPVNDGDPHHSYDACAKPDSVECSESASYPVGFGGTNDELVILSVADERKRCEQSSSLQLKEEKINDNLIRLDNLSADAPPKGSMEIKRSAIMVSTVRNGQHSLSNHSSKRPHQKHVDVGTSECAKLASDYTLSMEVKENETSEKTDHQHFSRQLCESDPDLGRVLPHRLSCSSSLGSSKKKKTSMSSEANLEEQRHRNLLAQNLKEHGRLDIKAQCSKGRGINVSHDCSKSRVPEVSEDRTSASHHKSNFSERFSKDSTISSMVECNMRAEPLLEPIWRGSFNIWNKNNDLLDGLMAHMSSQACQKVYDEARLFQPMLHLEMLPKSDVWPKSFETSEPSGENIALYFFPSDMRSERVFDHLVDEMVHKELSLRAYMQNAELLVFSSRELPLPYWRFQSKYYLWGVFREKPDPPLRSQSCSGESRYSPKMCKDCLDDTNSRGGKIPVTVKSFGARSPLSPLSNSSNNSRTS